MDAQADSGNNALKCARGLGWFSIGLGAAELFLPGQLGRLIGVRGHHNLIRAMGVREIAAGIAVLLEKKPVYSLANRVAGDAVDLSLLGAAMASSNSCKGRVGAALGAVAGVTALDVICTMRLGKAAHAISTTATVAVNKTPEECYRFWRDFEKLPQFMEHLQSVHVTGDNRSHWVAKAPAGLTAEWDAELIRDTPERIEWRSLPGADVDNTGSVEFRRAPAGHGTIIKASIEYKLPAGQVGAAVASLFGREPRMQTRSDLKRFKAVIETGEVPTIIGQSSGRHFSRT
ncbi:MAG TPA: SRPBCC family protein [Bryobacteraceae bacterium]|nr:SRPBCC family protein [Bryobacteraceae bacterium]